MAGNTMKEKEKKKTLIYVVDDEPDILELISINLVKTGFDVQKFTEAMPMMLALANTKPEMIILDLMLPDSDGMDICKLLRSDIRYSEIPIIMVTAKTDELDVVLGLELGADDYIPKPFSPRELVARIKAVLRREKRKDEQRPKQITIGNVLVIDSSKYEVLAEGKKITLTSTEFMILKLLAEKPGWVFSREKILDLLWGDDKDVFDRTIDVHIKNLREKLGPASHLIKNIRGVGYKLEI